MSQRLPIPGSDDGTWGDILNAYLEISHNPDGTLLPSAVTAAGAARDSTVVHNTGNETITGAKDFTGGITINGTNVVVTNDTRLTDQRVPTDGSVTDTKIGSGGLTNAAIATNAVISNTKIAGLGNSSTKDVGTTTGTVAAGDDSRITGAISQTSGDTRYVQQTTLGAASGVATLTSSSQLTASQLPGTVVTGGSAASPLSAAVTFLPLPTGTAATDTVNLNSVLAQGGRIRPNPLALTAAYSLTAPLVLAHGGNTDVDFGACTFTLLGTYNLLQNSAVAPSNTASDASTTIGSSVVASPTLAAVAQAGMQIAVVGAGYTGGDGAGPTWLYGTVQSVAGNNITLTGNTNGVAASHAVSGATAYLWKTRDTNIRVAGGTWNAASIWTARSIRFGAANNSSFLRFRRVDGLSVKSLTLTQTTFTGGLGWCFGIDPADCTDLLIEDIMGQNASTCINGTGPLTRATVRNIRGQTQDDQVAFGCTSATGADTEGDVSDLLIDGVWSNNSLCCVDLYSGQGGNGVVRYLDASVRGVKGTSQLHSIRVQDYAGVGQINARIEDVTARAATGNQAISNTTQTGRVSTTSAGFEPADAGFLIASCDTADVATSLAVANSFMLLVMIKVPRQVVVTNLVAIVSVAGSGLTAGQNLAGIYDGSTGALIAATVDQSSNWNSLGIKTMALTAQSGQSLTLRGGPGRFVWAAFICNGTTRPTLACKAVTNSFPVDLNLGGGMMVPLRGAYDTTGAMTALPASIATHTISRTAYILFAAAN